MSEREIIRVWMNDDGVLEVTITPFLPPEQNKQFADEIAETIMRFFGDDVLNEFKALNPANPIAH